MSQGDAISTLDNMKESEEYVNQLVVQLIRVCNHTNDHIHTLTFLDNVAHSVIKGKLFPVLSACANTCLPEEPFPLNLLVFKSRRKSEWYQQLIDKLLEMDLSKGKQSSYIPENISINMLSPNTQELNITIKSQLFSIRINNLESVYKSAILSGFNKIIGNNNLFKRSFLLIKAWFYYEMQSFTTFPFIDLDLFLKSGAIEVMTMCVFSISSYEETISSPLTALLSFLHYFSVFNWNQFEITAAGPIDKSTLRAPQDPNTLINQVSTMIDKYQKLWLSVQGLDSEKLTKYFEILDNDVDKLSHSLSIMDLLRPGKKIPMSSFVGLCTPQRREITSRAFSSTFDHAFKNFKMKLMNQDTGEYKDETWKESIKLLPNIYFICTSWHGDIKTTTELLPDDGNHEMLETPDSYMQELVSYTEFISLGKITGEDIVRAASHILYDENKPMKISDLMTILQSETENPHLLNAVKSLGGFKRIVSSYSGVIQLGEDLNNLGNPFVYNIKRRVLKPWAMISANEIVSGGDKEFQSIAFLKSNSGSPNDNTYAINSHNHHSLTYDDMESFTSETTNEDTSPRTPGGAFDAFSLQLKPIITPTIRPDSTGPWQVSPGGTSVTPTLNPNNMYTSPYADVALERTTSGNILVSTTTTTTTTTAAASAVVAAIVSSTSSNSLSIPSVSSSPYNSTSPIIAPSVPPGFGLKSPSYEMNNISIRENVVTESTILASYPGGGISSMENGSQNNWSNNITNPNRTILPAGSKLTSPMNSVANSILSENDKLNSYVVPNLPNSQFYSGGNNPIVKSSVPDPMARRQTISQMPYPKSGGRGIGGVVTNFQPSLTSASGATIIDPATGAKVFNPVKPEVWVPGKFSSKPPTPSSIGYGYSGNNSSNNIINNNISSNNTTNSNINNSNSNSSSNYDYGGGGIRGTSHDESIRRPTFPISNTIGPSNPPSRVTTTRPQNFPINTQAFSTSPRLNPQPTPASFHRNVPLQRPIDPYGITTMNTNDFSVDMMQTNRTASRSPVIGMSTNNIEDKIIHSYSSDQGMNSSYLYHDGGGGVGGLSALPLPSLSSAAAASGKGKLMVPVTMEKPTSRTNSSDRDSLGNGSINMAIDDINMWRPKFLDD